MADNYEYLIQVCRSIQIICGILSVLGLLVTMILFFKLQIRTAVEELRPYKSLKSGLYIKKLSQNAKQKANMADQQRFNVTKQQRFNATGLQKVDAQDQQTMNIMAQTKAGFVIQRSVVLIHTDEMIEPCVCDNTGTY